jgi:dUTP pyrophosphatase
MSERLTLTQRIARLVFFKPLHHEAKAPTRKSSGSAGIDLYALQETTVPAHGRTLTRTGVRVDLPANHYGQLFPTSSLSLKTGLQVGAGVIDQDYTGEVLVLLMNNTSEDVIISKHAKIAQMVVLCFNSTQPVFLAGYIQCPNMLDSRISPLSQRGPAGFGAENTAQFFQPPQ